MSKTPPKENSASPKNSSSNPSPGEGQVAFYQDKNYGGGYAIYDGPNHCDSQYYMNYNNGDNMTNSISSLKTGSNSWLTIYDGDNYTGQARNYYPSTECDNLKDHDNPNHGNWGDIIASWRLYSAIPSSWNVGFNKSAFESQFPSWKKQSDLDGDYLDYETQGAGYHVHNLGLIYPDEFTMKISLKVCYQITAGTNDNVLLDILVNTDASLNSITYTYNAGNSVEIPGWVEKSVDAAVEVAGAVGALESAGISEAAAQEFVEDFNTICNIFNKVASAVFKLSQKDDGRFYLVPVVSHVIARALKSVTIQGQVPETSNPLINFSSNVFAGQLDQYTGVSVDMTNGQYVWDQWGGTSGYLNTVLNYQKDGRNYRTWLQEVDILRNNTGLIVSCKIDWENGAGDDHIVVLAGFSTSTEGTKMVFVQASVQFHKDEDDNLVTQAYMTDAVDQSDNLVYTSNLADAIYNDLNGQVVALNLGSGDTDEGRKSIPEIAKANVLAMTNSGT